MKKNLEKFQGEKVAKVDLISVKGGCDNGETPEYWLGSTGQFELIEQNYQIFGGFCEDSWLYRLMSGMNG